MYSIESEEWMNRASNHSDYIAQVLVCSTYYRENHQIYSMIANAFNQAMRLRIININAHDVHRNERISFEICHVWCAYYLRTLEWHNHLMHTESVNIEIRSRNADINTWLNRRQSFDEFVSRNGRMPDSYPNGFSYPQEVIEFFQGRLSNEV
jgi:hypothetical protein